ncbi:MAG: hypothetical protein AAGE52_27975 [Myxococcota bacterium]
MPLIAELISVVVFLVIVGVVWGVVALNKGRGAASGGVWQQVAMQLGGTHTPGGGFRGQRIDVQHPFTHLSLEIKLLSAVNVASSPYHQGRPLGGTFTHATATFGVNPGTEYKCSKAQALQHAGFHGLPIASLPNDAEIISFPRDVMIVMNGHVKDANVLHAAAHIVLELARRQAGAPAPQPVQQPVQAPAYGIPPQQ